MLNESVIKPLSSNLFINSSPIARHYSSYNSFSNKNSNQNFNHSDANVNINQMPVHLISSDLWEAITGEHLSPISICQILSYYLPLTATHPNQNGANFSSTDNNMNNANNFHYNNRNSSFETGNGQSLQGIQYVVMSKDRLGSRNLQQQLEEGNKEERSIIFDALYPSFTDLVSDQAANFVIQKLCEVTTPEQHEKMLQFFLSHIESVVDQPNSCRVLQRFIECNSSGTEAISNVEKIFDAVKKAPGLLNLCFSQNGNHIVQRFIELLPDRTNEVIRCIIPHLVDLAGDNCGCRVVQRLFERYSVDILAPLVDEVLKHSASLATNQYGNYVVQNILEAKRPEHISRLISNFKGHFYNFSMHKFASNVVEKVIRAADGYEQQIIFNEILGGNEDDNSYNHGKSSNKRYKEDRILNMIMDQFGNYVMQRIIEFGSESQQNTIANVVYNNYDSLITINFAKHVISKLEEIGFQF